MAKVLIKIRKTHLLVVYFQYGEIRQVLMLRKFCRTAIFDNIGCGSEGQNQINLFCSSLTLHYLLII